MKTHKFAAVLLVLSMVSCKPTKYAKLDDGMYVDMETSKGTILLKLEFEKTPVTVANFVSLAEGTNKFVPDSLKGKRFFDGLIFHRVIKDFMIQCGDPIGTGEGGPGYKFIDEFPMDESGKLVLLHNKPGILSMANSGHQTNGSQFFITHKETPWLDGKHTVFGEVIDGQAVVDSIVQNDVIIKIEIVKIGKKAKNFEANKVFSKFFSDFEKSQKLKQETIEKAAKSTLIKMIQLKEEAKELTSGLQIAFIETKGGEKPVNGANVKVNYAGYFTDGRLFETSFKEVAKAHGVYDETRDLQNGYAPLTTLYGPEARLIAGFREGLQNLKVGDRAMLFIPSHLGYGAQGAGGKIPPNTDLVFEIELVEIVK
ncbi:peptidylprolyl isomerase [Lutibacter sp.]|uniref:peptidylprolyl isomerase n=1 Tax=Lutibacter sp. TaxID=1925666 RepID=UPI002735BB9C|nr:peptidylprolyl isomerase [Lutibacter sp.]MDP3311803.1 peptidylprolyl isomerase [Lutibacter sp.]